jgi:hypothetical protein
MKKSKKAEVKISTFIIGMIVASLAVVFFSLFMSSLSSAYTINYNNSSLETYNKLDELANHTKAIQESSENLKQNSNLLDVLNGFFNDAYKTLLVTKQSFNTWETLASDGIDSLNLGASGRYLKVAITSIVIILIIIGVLISAIVKKDL